MINTRTSYAAHSPEGFPSFRRALLLTPPIVDLRKLACGNGKKLYRRPARAWERSKQMGAVVNPYRGAGSARRVGDSDGSGFGHFPGGFVDC